MNKQPPPAAFETSHRSSNDTGAAHADVFDRTSSFRVTYVAVLLFLLLYLFTVEVFQTYLQSHFEQRVDRAIDVEVSARHPAQDIRLNLIEVIGLSPWVDPWGVQVAVEVLANDESTLLYVNGRAQIPSDRNQDPLARIELARRLLPATASVDVDIDHDTVLSNTILIVYGTILFSVLFLYNRHIVVRENALLDEARQSRDLAATRAHQIESEIKTVRAQLRSVEPAKQEDREEIARLQRERLLLQTKLEALAEREQRLRNEADRAVALEQEGRALEELLDEATEDLTAKNREIGELEKHLRKAAKTARRTGGKTKESEVFSKRMKALYPRLDIDDRAIDDFVALADDTTKLRAEECLKRLNEEADNRGVRRKVGGLPNHLSVYEIGFAGKRRIYFVKVDKGRARVLVIGAKNTQQSDLDYIARLPKSDFIEGLPATSRGG